MEETVQVIICVAIKINVQQTNKTAFEVLAVLTLMIAENIKIQIVVIQVMAMVSCLQIPNVQILTAIADIS